MRYSSAGATAILFALFIGGLAAVAPDLSGQEFPEGVTRALIEEGRSIFLGPGLCAACHGSEATGVVGPNLTDDEWLHGSGTYQEIVRRVMSGVAADEAKNTMGAIMPPRGGSGITDEQVRAVAAYVWSLSHLKEAEGGGSPKR